MSACENTPPGVSVLQFTLALLPVSQPSFKFNAMRDDAVLDNDDDGDADAGSDAGGNGAPENCVTSCQATMHAPQAADGGMQKAVAAPPFLRNAEACEGVTKATNGQCKRVSAR